MSNVTIRPLEDGDTAWVAKLLTSEWGSTMSVSRGRLLDVSTLPGFVAILDGQQVGLATYHQSGSECELVTLNTTYPAKGVGTELLQAVLEVARKSAAARLWLITTNDNWPAIKFYLKRGLRLVAIHRDAMDESRRLKPEIPLLGVDGIPITDEIEMEIRFS